MTECGAPRRPCEHRRGPGPPPSTGTAGLGVSVSALHPGERGPAHSVRSRVGSAFGSCGSACPSDAPHPPRRRCRSPCWPLAMRPVRPATRLKGMGRNDLSGAPDRCEGRQCGPDREEVGSECGRPRQGSVGPPLDDGRRASRRAWPLLQPVHTAPGHGLVQVDLEDVPTPHTPAVSPGPEEGLPPRISVPPA